MAKLRQARPMPWPANAVKAPCVLSVSLKGTFALYVPIVSLLCPFCVLEHVASVVGKRRVMRLIQHSKTIAGQARQSSGKLSLYPKLQKL